MNSEKPITLDLAYLGVKTKTVRLLVHEHGDRELLPVMNTFYTIKNIKNI